MARRALWPALALGLGLLAAAGSPSPARAHAALVETTPADGAALAAPPDEILLRFNEPVRPITVRVLDRAGKPVAGSGRIEAEDGTLRVALPAPLPKGSYAVSYRVASADGHPVSGAFVFAVGQAPPAPAPDATRTDAGERGWQAATALNRAIHYAALLAAAGGAIFLLLLAGGIDPSLRAGIARGLSAAAGLGIATAILAPGLEGGLLLDAPAGAVLGPVPWRAGAASSAGPSALAAVAGLALVMLGLRMPPGRRGAAALALGALAAVGSILLTGHPAATDPRWLTVPAWGAHLLTVAFWVGALWPLLVVLRDQPSTASRVLERFSRLAVAAVGLLVAAGLTIAVVQVGRVAALTSTDYGRLLLLKLALVAGLLLIAARNKLRLTPALAAGEASAPARLRRAIRLEIGAAALILAVTAVLGQTPPPNALPGGARHGPEAARHAGPEGGQAAGSVALASADGRQARIEVTPAAAGPNTVTVTLTTAEGEPLTPLVLSVAFSLPAAGIAPIERRPAAIGPGRYRLSGFDFLIPGRWTIRIEVLVTDFDEAVLTAEVAIR